MQDTAKSGNRGKTHTYTNRGCLPCAHAYTDTHDDKCTHTHIYTHADAY